MFAGYRPQRLPQVTQLRLPTSLFDPTVVVPQTISYYQNTNITLAWKPHGRK